MSGPKTMNYELERRRLQLLEEERLRQREERQKLKLRKKIERLEQEYVTLQQKAQQVSVHAPKLPIIVETNNLKIIEEHSRAVDQAVKALSASIQGTINQMQATADQRATQMLGNLSSVAAHTGTRSVEEAIEAEKQRILAQQTKPIFVPNHLDQEEAREYLDAIGDPTDAASTEIVDQLQRVVDGEVSLDADLAEQAGLLIKFIRQRETGKIVTEIASEALAEIGFVVDEGFSTLFIEGGMAHIQRPEWGHYFVRMRVNPEEQTINVNMVRSGDPSTQASTAELMRDAKMEETWCGDHARLVASMNEQGLHAQFVRHLAPGARPVQVVAPETVGRVGQAKGKTRPKVAAQEKAKTQAV